MQKVFPDTNVLMENSSEIFSLFDKIYICGYVLSELDKHKISSDENKRFLAREASRNIELNESKIKYVIDEYWIDRLDIPDFLDKDSMDNKIIWLFNKLYDKDNEIVGLSNDLLFRQKCKMLDLPCENFGSKNTEIYTGFKEVILNDNQMSLHYQNPQNIYSLLNNQYLLIKNEQGEIVDKQRWTDDKGFLPLSTKAIKPVYFEDIKPRDAYQMMAIDSLNNTDFTLLSGMAGTAKTLLSLGWIMQGIKNGKINKCVIIYNSVPLKNSQYLGYYSGDRNQKLLQTSLGGILSSKLGDMSMVEGLITSGKLLIIPSCDIRGIEISDNDCLFVTEAQNTDAYIMKTILQRAKDKCKVIVEGDMLEQQDIKHVNKYNNGMIKVIEAFKGTKHFSCVQLQNTYRSPIAEIAEKIK